MLKPLQTAAGVKVLEEIPDKTPRYFFVIQHYLSEKKKRGEGGGGEIRTQ